MRKPSGNLMNLNNTISLYCEGAGQSDSSSLIGRKYTLVDTKYGHEVGEYDTPEEAEKAMLARPYTKIRSTPEVWQTQLARNVARKKFKTQNPDNIAPMKEDELPENLHKREVQDV